MIDVGSGVVVYDLGDIADWLSGIGTIAAVITAYIFILYLLIDLKLVS